MDQVKNPFVPGAGTPPPELAGRSLVLEKAHIAVSRVREGKSAKSLILVGLRGVGKTVLLVRIRDMAEEAKYKAVMIEAHEGKPLSALLVPSLRQILFQLDKVAGAGEKVKRGLRVLRSFMSSIKLTIADVDVGLSIEPERGTGDSGDLEADLGELFLAVGEAAKAARTAIAICIDELQYLNETEFSALIMAIHKVTQMQLPLVMVGAGLPQILGLAGESKSYAERLFDYPKVGALAVKDAMAALEAPVATEGVSFTPDAIQEILKMTECYPYFLQQWGHEAWNLAKTSPIDITVVKAATAAAISTLDQGFFRVRLDRCTPSEKRYLRALADLGAGAQRSGEIAEVLGLKASSVGPTRSKLILKGMIYSPQHGDTEFTVPMFDSYMRRAMPGSDWNT
jgi:AAA ATPase domain